MKDVGRQGITFASVKGAQVSDVIVNRPGLDDFDFEADQWNEGAKNVTIDGCETVGTGFFFANGGSSDGQHTGHIAVRRCSMSQAEGGSAILVTRAGHDRVLRGPYTFQDDSLRCGASDYVACVQLSAAAVTVSESSFRFPTTGTVHEPVYHAAAGTTVTFERDVVSGYGRRGTTVGKRAHVKVIGGQWSPWSGDR